MIAEFFSHGALTDTAKDIVVYSNRELVPMVVLQQGPGDFCRVAFQLAKNQPRYFIYYGGAATAQDERPKWTARCGLLFETREWRPCDMTAFESVRDAFAASIRIGSDFVGGVFHRYDPFAAEQGPFLSRYVGIMNAPLTGNYVFYTSSQDCSFLVIDGELIVAAPGTHIPETRAKIKSVVTLNEGPHQFEYYHVAGGPESCMVAAWELPGMGSPSKISPDVFQYDRVLRVPPAHLEHRDDGYLPDFRMAILGDIPSPEENEPAMVRTQFMDASTKAITLSAKYEWSFGDGQKSEFENPAHVFLHPGAYRVGLTLQRGGKQTQVTNRIYVTRQFIIDTKGQEGEDLTAYLEALEQYNSDKLDAMGLVQLVRAYLLADDFVNAAQAAAAAFSPTAVGHTDQSRWLLAQLVGPALREKLNNPKAATNLWMAASQQIKNKTWRAECAVEAADILLNDMLDQAAASGLLAAAEEILPEATSLTRSRYHRVLGDWHARTGNGKDGRSAYLKAEAVRELPYSTIESTAWRGAHSRSSEAFLRSEEWERAREELQNWLQDFPADKYEGYLSLLQMRYWIARGKFPQAMAVASDLLAVNPHSPYADRLVFLTAKSEEESKRLAQAIAAYHSLVTDYPGSPLVEAAKIAIKRLTEPVAVKPAVDEKKATAEKNK
jgi:PKD repeat protein